MYLAPQNIPRAISVGNKVVLYCMLRCFCFRADSITALLSHAMLHAEIRFTRPVLNIHRSGAFMARYGSGDSSVV